MCGKTGPCASGWAETLLDDCPPKTALDASGQALYRFLEAEVIQAIDFHSHRKRGKHTGSHPECFARAVSVYSNLPLVRKIHYLATKKKKRIARIAPTLGHGAVTLPDETSHMSWWPCGAIDPVTMATMVNESDNA